MKKAISFIVLASLLILAACESDDFNVNDPRLNYVGTWDVNEKTGDFAPQSYTVSIDLGDLASNIVIRGLYAQGPMFLITAIVNGRNLEIPVQTRTGLTISGSGTSNPDFNLINLQFSVNDGSTVDNVSAEMKKR
ncbi:MAG: hypothetical protein ACK4KT_09785 [Thermaurantimonas sp.]